MNQAQLDITRDSVTRLREHVAGLIKRAHYDSAATDYERGWFDGYLRAVEHVLEMEKE